MLAFPPRLYPEIPRVPAARSCWIQKQGEMQKAPLIRGAFSFCPPARAGPDFRRSLRILFWHPADRLSEIIRIGAEA